VKRAAAGKAPAVGEQNYRKKGAKKGGLRGHRSGACVEFIGQ